MHNINFHDEAMTPAAIRELSEGLIQSNIDIKWSTDARLDKGLNREVLNVAHKAGLSVLFFGLESINPRVLGLINKGTNPAEVERILRDTKDLNIWSHLFYICGFPTETEAEFNETLKFICDNNNVIASSGLSTYSMGLFSPVAQNPDKFEVSVKADRNPGNASLYYEFMRHSEQGLSHEDIGGIFTQNVNRILIHTPTST